MTCRFPVRSTWLQKVSGSEVDFSDNSSLVIFNADGGYLKTIPTEDYLGAIAFDSQNQLWAIDSDQVIRLTINDQ